MQINRCDEINLTLHKALSAPCRVFGSRCQPFCHSLCEQRLFTVGSTFWLWYRHMWDFFFSQGLNSRLAACLPLLYLDYKVVHLHQLVLTQHAGGSDVVAVGQRWDSSGRFTLREITFAHLTGAQITIQQTQIKHTSGHRQSLNTPIWPQQHLSVVRLNTNTGSKPNKLHISKVSP